MKTVKKHLYELERNTIIDVSDLDWRDENGVKLNKVLFLCVDGAYAKVMQDKKIYYLSPLNVINIEIDDG